MPDDSRNTVAQGGFAARQAAWLQRARAWPARNWPWDLIAFVWGLAEATVFFIAPEVLVSWLALGNPLRALRAAFFALIGGIIGITILYLWGGRDPFSAMALLSAVPGVGQAALESAEEALLNGWPAAVAGGVFSLAAGKAQAIYAQSLGIGLLPFLAVYALARAVRLLLAGCLTLCIGALLQCLLPRRVVVALWMLAWGAFYLFVFAGGG